MATEEKDITLKTDWGMFNFRTAYIAFSEGRVLLEKSSDGYWFVPGGRVAFGEDTKTSLIREVAEELSFDVKNPQMAGFLENFFTLNGKPYHEISTYYTVEVPKDFTPPTEEANGDTIHLEWHQVESLPELDMHPSILKDKISGLIQDAFSHYIQRD